MQAPPHWSWRGGQPPVPPHVPGKPATHTPEQQSALWPQSLPLGLQHRPPEQICPKPLHWELSVHGLQRPLTSAEVRALYGSALSKSEGSAPEPG